MVSFHDNLDKPMTECQTVSDFAAARGDGGGNWNSLRHSPKRSSPPTYQHSRGDGDGRSDDWNSFPWEITNLPTLKSFWSPNQQSQSTDWRRTGTQYSCKNNEPHPDNYNSVILLDCWLQVAYVTQYTVLVVCTVRNDNENDRHTRRSVGQIVHPTLNSGKGKYQFPLYFSTESFSLCSS